MGKHKKIKKSRFANGERVMMRKKYGRYFEGQIVVILDNEKKKPGYTNKVKDQLRGIVDNVPIKYLKGV